MPPKPLPHFLSGLVPADDPRSFTQVPKTNFAVIARWSAISRGAVAKGLSTAIEDEIVTNAIAKYSYGICYNAPFNPKKHLDQDKYFCPIEQKEKASNQVTWYLKRVSQRPHNVPSNFLRCDPERCSQAALGRRREKERPSHISVVPQSPESMGLGPLER